MDGSLFYTGGDEYRALRWFCLKLMLNKALHKWLKILCETVKKFLPCFRAVNGMKAT